MCSWALGRAVRLVVVVGVLAAGLGFVGVSGATAQTVGDVGVRDRLIADQEALLNVYRCRFNVDTQIVPGGCSNGVPVLPPQKPSQFSGIPSSQDIAIRDQLIADQEALLNVYRCTFSIDTQIVPGGCQDDTGTEPTPAEPTPEPVEPVNLGPVAPNEPFWSDTWAIYDFAVDCGFYEAPLGECDDPADTEYFHREYYRIWGCSHSRRGVVCANYATIWEARVLISYLACPFEWFFYFHPDYDMCYHTDHPYFEEFFYSYRKQMTLDELREIFKESVRQVQAEHPYDPQH